MIDPTKFNGVSVQVIGRMFMILEVLVQNPGRPVRLKEVVSETGLDASTAHRLLNDLALLGYLGKKDHQYFVVRGKWAEIVNASCVVPVPAVDVSSQGSAAFSSLTSSLST